MINVTYDFLGKPIHKYSVLYQFFLLLIFILGLLSTLCKKIHWQEIGFKKI